MAELSAGNRKLIQYLNEAYGLERRLEVALQGHLPAATRSTYRQRLRDHLSETKRHGRDLAKRIKQLGGSAETIDLPGPDALSGVAQSAVAGAQRVAALAQGPLHDLRGIGEQEKQLRNAKTEYASEAEEIAAYSAILSLAEALGDRDTARLARTILREEERMSSFLEKEIPRIVQAVTRAEIPSSQRVRPKRARRTASRSRSASSRQASPSRRSGPSAQSSRPSGRSSSSGARSATRARSGRGARAKVAAKVA